MVSPELQTAETITETMADNVLRLERTLDAPRGIVYRAWTDPVHLAQWWGPEGMSTPNCELDVRPGGKWRTCMMGEDKTEHWVQGVYRELDPPEKLVFTWAWEEDGQPGHETVVTIELRDDGPQTQMVLTQTGFESVDSRDKHGQGWSSSFNCLNQFFDIRRGNDG